MSVHGGVPQHAPGRRGVFERARGSVDGGTHATAMYSCKRNIYKSYSFVRQIGKMLNAREPKIVNGPQILDKYVGESEANIRKLFAEAEEEEKRVRMSLFLAR